MPVGPRLCRRRRVSLPPDALIATSAPRRIIRRHSRGVGTLKADIVPIPFWMTVSGERRGTSLGPAGLDPKGPGSAPVEAEERGRCARRGEAQGCSRAVPWKRDRGPVRVTARRGSERECRIRRAAAEAGCAVAAKGQSAEDAGTGMVKPHPCDRMAGGGGTAWRRCPGEGKGLGGTDRGQFGPPGNGNSTGSVGPPIISGRNIMRDYFETTGRRIVFVRGQFVLCRLQQLLGARCR